MPLFQERNPILQMASVGEHRPQLAGEVAEVLPGGPAFEAGIQPGDLIVAVNGSAVEDVIDVQYYAAEDACVLTIRRGASQLDVSVQKDIDRQLGIAFRDDLFDGIRICANRCDFCFVDQQPRGMRQTLQIRDDDYRLSFLHGNFVTLTNLTDRDWERVFRQGLSPLYISVHATDHDVRCRVLRNKKAGGILSDIRRLVSGGVRLHTQVVLCEGVNDGEVLDRTIRDLGELYPDVMTLAVVPMGVTDYRLARNESPPYDRHGALRVLRQIRGWQRQFEGRHGVRFVYPSDEFYLLAQRPLPRRSSYQGFPQLSNGLGGSRIFLDEVRACRHRNWEFRLPCRVQLVTGVLAEPLVRVFGQALEELAGCRVQVVPAENNWYGHSTTVAGLLTGRDVRDALNRAGQADVAVIPDVMLRENTDAFLDDVTVAQLARDVGRPVVPVSMWPLEAMEALSQW